MLSFCRCKSCNHVMTTEEVEDWMYKQLEDTNHLLHGVVHANGFGHLLRVNGREGGSRVLSGAHIMDFWDRICKVLGVRQVSVTDVSKKYGMEFRLLHSVVKGNPWYGDWGYEFGAGSYAITREDYKNAIETLANVPLYTFSSQGSKPQTHLQDLIAFYQSRSELEIETVRDLFRYLTTLMHNAAKNRTMVGRTSKKAKPSECRVLSVWNASDIVLVEEAMFRVLRAVSGTSWVSLRSLRGAVCRVGPPELLDHCLKELKGKQVPNGMVVDARSNPESGALEYRLEPGSLPLISAHRDDPIAICPSEDLLLRDLRYLYKALLYPRSMVNHVPITKSNTMVNSAMKLLDCKQFVKNYHPESLYSKANPNSLILSCKPELTEQISLNLPPEYIILSPNATIHYLKVEASKAFQEVYIILRRFQAEELVGHTGVDDSTKIKLLGGSKVETLTLRGKCQNGLSKFRMERGEETWTMDCRCGAQDDDGERMLACDVCGVWQHTRCAGIPDCNMAPGKFVCCKCDHVRDGNGAMLKGSLFEVGGKVDLFRGCRVSMHLGG
ncbi:PHD finger protein At1g33420-like isoform X2 [Rutidosis leptorrhynchoides]|uniref:PHD finger protein At1g33420-like isoform X2 n=1 Tax=Rutidosis leptorrhynchoides TaxID=125765 RepID=UPI003A98E24D